PPPSILFPSTTLFRSPPPRCRAPAGRSSRQVATRSVVVGRALVGRRVRWLLVDGVARRALVGRLVLRRVVLDRLRYVHRQQLRGDRKSTRLNSSHVSI